VLNLKVLVAYSTRTNNTKKIAEAIYGEIEFKKEIRKMDELDNLDGYELIFFGFPIENYGPPQKVREFLKEHSANKKISLFLTHGSPEFSDFLPPWLEESKNCLDNSTELLGLFNCQGDVAQFVIDSMSESDDPILRYFAQESSKIKGQPDETRIKKAKDFANEILNKAI
jgi:flavodoxin